MHRALCIPEIQILITEFSPTRKALAALAQSGKIWTEIALDTLYGQEIPFVKALYPLFPTSRYQRGDCIEGSYFFSKEITAEKFERYSSYYAPRVRFITNFRIAPPFERLKKFFAHVSSNLGTPWFPNLISMVDSTNDAKPVKYFPLSSDQTSEKGDVTWARVLLSLHSLEVVSVTDAIQPTFDVLQDLPCLRVLALSTRTTLVFTSPHFFPTLTSFTWRSDKQTPQFSLPPKHYELLMVREIFVSALTGHCSGLLAMTKATRISSLELFIARTDHPSDFERLDWTNLMNTVHSLHNLTKLYMTVPTRTHADTPLLSFSDLRPLIALKRLEYFSVTSSEALEVFDEDIEEMLLSWTELISWKLDVFQVTSPVRQLTLRCLIAFAKHPKLREAHIILPLVKGPIETDLIDRATSSISRLALRSPKIDGIDRVSLALFIAKLFPRLENVHFVRDDGVQSAQFNLIFHTIPTIAQQLATEDDVWPTE
ncbi:hypothetical protein DL96DRAFT_1562689 [Flagelloscypha sp. PMI_526]|nr:hypothetical protein DL96DRAFT_1562689 [Flagelloscypha sp. PMI_526]